MSLWFDWGRIFSDVPVKHAAQARRDEEGDGHHEDDRIIVALCGLGHRFLLFFRHDAAITVKRCLAVWACAGAFGHKAKTEDERHNRDVDGFLRHGRDSNDLPCLLPVREESFRVVCSPQLRCAVEEFAA